MVVYDTFDIIIIEDLTQMVISYGIYEMSLRWVSYEMTKSVRFYLSYGCLIVIISP